MLPSCRGPGQPSQAHRRIRALARRAEILRSIAGIGPVATAVLCADMRVFYQRLTDCGKPHQVAITAVIRKLVVLANALLRDDRLWQPLVPAKA